MPTRCGYAGTEEQFSEEARSSPGPTTHQWIVKATRQQKETPQEWFRRAA